MATTDAVDTRSVGWANLDLALLDEFGAVGTRLGQPVAFSLVLLNLTALWRRESSQRDRKATERMKPQAVSDFFLYLAVGTAVTLVLVLAVDYVRKFYGWMIRAVYPQWYPFYSQYLDLFDSPKSNNAIRAFIVFLFVLVS